ncbi:glucose/sorbosone dehydrogenase [Halalkaliarchaeum desulfuricum]|uniref:Glucose/sorbosone dehydrogenase n=1 Tax=Halalkaliarchaeum desulfuricum TaxID=2055893 RepID=A0A343TGK0_9EURY|nr:PQQ-dependent sugar dehydrogenase [Halalkaliarchaeum desulfuricum]AUX08222.1 glucose/sorbosone dehydrogenase [Halalkaliarchaeum desulfuricum]
MKRLTRRRALSALGTGSIVVAAGCLGDDDPDSDGEPEADESGEATDPDPVEAEYDLSVDHDINTWDGYDPEWEPPTEPPEDEYAVETLVEGLEIPWDLAFAPDGELFVSERPGRILRYDAGTVEAIAEPDDVVDAEAIDVGDEGGWWAGGGEGGLMGIAVHPNYPDVPLLYVYYTYDGHGGERNRLAYYDVSADEPAETHTTVFEDVPGDRIHNGGRIAFGPKNYLWIATGDAGSPEQHSQDPSSLAGKILRIEPDGSAPEDNPDLGDGADPRVFTYGHRNAQGISFFPDGTPVISEHGPSARDEVIVLASGENHGWPDARDGEEYPGTDFARPAINSGTSDTWAPAGTVFYTGGAVPSLRNRLLVGGLGSEQLYVVTLSPAGEPEPDAERGIRYDEDWLDPDWQATAHSVFEGEHGRIRHVEQGPDGTLYAVTSNRDGRASDAFPQEGDDRLVRITPP